MTIWSSSTQDKDFIATHISSRLQLLSSLIIKSGRSENYIWLFTFFIMFIIDRNIEKVKFGGNERTMIKHSAVLTIFSNQLHDYITS